MNHEDCPPPLPALSPCLLVVYPTPVFCGLLFRPLEAADISGIVSRKQGGTHFWLDNAHSDSLTADPSCSDTTASKVRWQTGASNNALLQCDGSLF